MLLPRLAADDFSKGLNRVACDIAKSLFRTHAVRQVLQSKQERQSEETNRRSVCNDLQWLVDEDKETITRAQSTGKSF